MTAPGERDVVSAEAVLPCAELASDLAFFTERLGFRLEAIRPADAPTVAVISGYGLRLRLEQGASAAPVVLRLSCRDGGGGVEVLTAPGGTRVELVAPAADPVVPALAPSLSLSRGADGGWVVGRAGMQYRDLVPDRQGGRFIASHIRIPDGGPVPDLVHYHRLRWQMIYCRRGWVRVVYQDQGPPLVMRAGDCVLQPPEIRHRVLECSPGLEVVELACPAAHPTVIDHDLELPTAAHRPERDFGGQRFLHHQAEGAPRRAHRDDGFEVQDSGMATATAGLASAEVVRRTTAAATSPTVHDGELLFRFVLDGKVTLESEGRDDVELSRDDAFVVPAGVSHRLAGCSADLEILEVTLPAAVSER